MATDLETEKYLLFFNRMLIIVMQYPNKKAAES
jgi:hypothetical protein